MLAAGLCIAWVCSRNKCLNVLSAVDSVLPGEFSELCTLNDCRPVQCQLKPLMAYADWTNLSALGSQKQKQHGTWYIVKQKCNTFRQVILMVQHAVDCKLQVGGPHAKNGPENSDLHISSKPEGGIYA